MEARIRLKEIMKEQGISSAALAEMIDVSKVTISNLINNKTMPSIETLDKIAQKLNIPMWQLFVSKKEISERGNVSLCPHCGKPIEIDLKKKE